MNKHKIYKYIIVKVTYAKEREAKLDPYLNYDIKG